MPVYEAMNLAHLHNQARRVREELPLLRQEMRQYLSYYRSKHQEVHERISMVSGLLASPPAVPQDTQPCPLVRVYYTSLVLSICSS